MSHSALPNSSGLNEVQLASSRDSDLCQTNEIPYLHSKQIDCLNSFRLGRGTFGFVEKIRFRKSENDEYVPAAVKYANDEQHKENLKREAKVMLSLGVHPNILKIYGIYNSPQNGFGVVMEFMDCNSLAELIKNKNIDYTFDHFVSWMYQLSLAVEFFHQQNKVHRDLKLQNILLSNRYIRVKVCDFGTFTAIHQSMTINLGTPITMAPEVFQGKHYGSKLDIYAIGIIMWQIIARRDPYKKVLLPVVLLYNVAQTNLRPEELNCSPIISNFYKRCWHNDPEKRPTSTEVREYFEILKNQFPNGNQPLTDKRTSRIVKTPQPGEYNNFPNSNQKLQVNEKKTHRRAGSDQTTFLQQKQPNQVNTDLLKTKNKFETKLIQSDRDNRFACDEIKEWFLQNPLQKPSEPNENDLESIEIFNEHVSSCAEIVNILKIEKEILEAKHKKVMALEQNEFRLQLAERIEYLKKLVEKAKLPMTPNQTNE